MSQPGNGGNASAPTTSERRSQAAFHRAPLGIAIVAPDGRWLDVNPRLCAIVGYSEDELRKLTFNDITHPEDLDADLALVRQVLDGAIQTYSLAKRYIRKDGSIVSTNLTVSLVRDADGKPEYFVSIVEDDTRRRQTDEALKESEARYRSVIDTMEEGIVVQGADLQIIAFNASALRILGLSEDQLRGRTSLDPRWYAIHEDGSPFPGETHPGTVSLLTGESFSNVIMGVHRADGSLVWLSINAQPLLHGGESLPIGSVASFTDITERKQAEAALRASQAQLKEAQRIAQVGSWELDLVSGSLLWSDEIFRIFEMDQAKFGASYEAFLNAIHPDDRDKVNQAYTDSVANRAPYEIAHRLRMPDGRIKWVNERCETFYDDQGKPLRSIGTVQDISEKQRMDDELNLHREHLEELVQERLHEAQRIGRMGNWKWDVASGEISWSDEIYRIFGYQPGAFTPTYERFLATLHPDDVQRIKQSEQEAFAQGKQHSIDHRILLPNGEMRWVHEEAVATMDESGKALSMAGTVQDITERKQTEQALEKAKDQAEQANRAKSEFLSRMSHELRTPMNAILGFSQVLEMEPISSEQLDFVHEIHAAGNHLLELINELLDLSRIEAGRLPIAIQPAKIGTVTGHATQLVKSLYLEKDVTLINSCEPDIMVLADPTRLKQVLVNLLSNAAKYNHAGGRVHIGCELLDADRLRLSVTDTGPGIAAEKVDQIFLPFERLGAEFTEVDGSGIGLALSKHLAEMMDAKLGVDSHPGQGSTFWINLPRAQGQVLSTIAQHDLAKAIANQMRILYIEDNAANLKVVEAMFRRQPELTLISASNGEYGLELARIYHPQVILLDIHLPGMDGFAVLNELQARPETRDIPVIALSADAMPLDVERGLAAGFCHYLTKPVKVQEIIDAVSNAIAEHAT